MSDYTVPAVHERRAEIIRVVDGDTVEVDVDLGCDVHIKMTLRLYGIDAPERGTEEGTAATAFVKEWAATHAVCALRTVKDRKEKYGRYLADLLPAEGPSLVEALLAAGHARPYPTR